MLKVINTNEEREKENPQAMRKYLQFMYLINDL